MLYVNLLVREGVGGIKFYGDVQRGLDIVKAYEKATKIKAQWVEDMCILSNGDIELQIAISLHFLADEGFKPVSDNFFYLKSNPVKEIMGNLKDFVLSTIDRIRSIKKLKK